MKILPAGTGKVEDLTPPDEHSTSAVLGTPTTARGARSSAPGPSPAKVSPRRKQQQPTSGRKRTTNRRDETTSAEQTPIQRLSVEQVAERYDVCLEDLREFAEFLDVDADKEKYLLPIVCESIAAELPTGWQECEDAKSGEAYYWNRATDTTSWEHPLDAGFREKIAARRKEGPSAWKRDAPRASSSSIAQTSSNSDVDMYSKGKELLAAKEYSKAIAVFTAAIAVDHPEQALCYNLRGVCHSWLGKQHHALRDADHAVKLRPSATLFCNRGKAYRALKRHADAKVDLHRALEMKPGHKHAVAELKSLEKVITGIG